MGVFDDDQVIWVGQSVRLHGLWLDGCEYQCWRVLGMHTLRKVFVG